MLHSTPLIKHTTENCQGYNSFILTDEEMRVKFMHIHLQLCPIKRQMSRHTHYNLKLGQRLRFQNLALIKKIPFTLTISFYLS